MSVDVGAADGAYLAYLLLYSARVVAFEPRPQAAARLRAHFGATALARLEEVALSDAGGTAEIRIPAQRPMLSTIARCNLLDGASDVGMHTVRCARLDDYQLEPVGFIKIDVEGHERAVLEGARETFRKYQPHCPGRGGGAPQRRVRARGGAVFRGPGLPRLFPAGRQAATRLPLSTPRRTSPSATGPMAGASDSTSTISCSSPAPACTASLRTTCRKTVPFRHERVTASTRAAGARPAAGCLLPSAALRFFRVTGSHYF